MHEQMTWYQYPDYDFLDGLLSILRRFQQGLISGSSIVRKGHILVISQGHVIQQLDHWSFKSTTAHKKDPLHEYTQSLNFIFLNIKMIFNVRFTAVALFILVSCTIHTSNAAHAAQDYGNDETLFNDFLQENLLIEEEENMNANMPAQQQTDDSLFENEHHSLQHATHDEIISNSFDINDDDELENFVVETMMDELERDAHELEEMIKKVSKSMLRGSRWDFMLQSIL